MRGFATGVGSKADIGAWAGVGAAPLRRGFSFAAGRVLIPTMVPDLENVIRQALGDALAAGKDHLSQTELAVRAVQRARPDMTASDALAAVNLVWRT